MAEKAARAIAVVGVGAVLPDAPDAAAFWANLKAGRYSISEVTTDRWDPALYYDPDPRAPDKTYSIIGGWVREVDFSPLEWRLPIPPKVSDAMDRTQKWAITAARQALIDYGYPDRPLDPDRTAVVLGNAMAGDMHYLTALRAYFPEYAAELRQAPTFAALGPEVRDAILDELLAGVRHRFPNITEDTMPGELGNIIAGRVANLYDFHGPNFVVDAACASALAAIDAAIEGLEQGDYDSVLTGGVDSNMGVPSFIKFCKIGALSATGTRPYHEGADGFVMGEGAAVFLLKRLEDAEAGDDHIYAVIRGLGGSSDGKGKGITAPNPVGQEFAVARAWRNANLTPDSATYIEGHGTSTRVGDVVETESLGRVFADLGLESGSIPMGSVKSNIGHLKSSAGAAGMLKALMSLNDKVLAPSLGGERPNPNIDFSRSPLYINKELAEWKVEPGQVRTAGVSAFGFGGTNFHVVLEEHIPGRLQVEGGKTTYAVSSPRRRSEVADRPLKAPLRGALVIGARDEAAVLDRLREVVARATTGVAPPPAPPAEADLRSPVRIAIDYGDAAELASKGAKAIKALESGNPGMWKALRNQGVFLGHGEPGKVAFLYTGQGSQYVNMLSQLRAAESIVAERFVEADQIMEPILGRPLSDYIFVDGENEAAMRQADLQLRQTEITQPAVLSVDAALTDMLTAYGIHPDMVMGHSLGEYGALVAAGALPFEDALEAVAGRGREMASVQVDDNGLMAAVFAPLDEVIRVVEAVNEYVVVANLNSTKQAVIGGSTPGVEAASQVLEDAGAQVVPLPVSHAFHTRIVAPAGKPLQDLLRRLRLEPPAIPLVANVDGEFYPMGGNAVPEMIDILGRQIASPVEFVKGLRTLHEAGCRVFVEVGPKKALHGFVEDVLGDDPQVVGLFSNHPKLGDITSFNHALCGLYAAGLGLGTRADAAESVAPIPAPPQPTTEHRPPSVPGPAVPYSTSPGPVPGGDVYSQLGYLFADFLSKGRQILDSAQAPTASKAPSASLDHPVVITGAGLGLPGGDRVFGDDNVRRLLEGEQFITSVPDPARHKITEKKITRLVKSEAGGGHFETIDDDEDVIKLAGRAGRIDLAEEFGFPAERIDALDRTSVLAIGAGLDALRDAGIPLAMHYKATTTGTRLPERWMLPEAYRDTTGVIFASAFPGADSIAEESERFHRAHALEQRLADLASLQQSVDGDHSLSSELARRITALQEEIADLDYQFNRKYLFRAVSMGHAQFAEYIMARGPNTQLNAACASTTQAVAVAEDWIRTGRCERVVIVSGDDVTNDQMLQWIGSGFLAVGAAATDDRVEDAALPFDRRRHGMILGMGAAAIVVESAVSAATRGIQPIAQVLSTVTANSAFHGSRLDPSHIRFVMEDLVDQAEQRWGINRQDIAPYTVFVSHETYTPARGGSAQAEVDALRHVFGESADQIVVTNTKGYTGHAMGVGIEDVLAIKSMETGIVPPVPNFREPDPDLGNLNLSHGGSYPIHYALRLGAGFGSQISLTLYRYVPAASGVRPNPDQLGFETRIVDRVAWERWLATVSGNPDAAVQIDRRTLRIRDDGPPAVAPAAAVAVPVPQQVAAPSPLPTKPGAPVPTDLGEPEPEADSSPAQTAATTAIPDSVADRVLEIVAEQTGYPTDMLDLDLDLEADLGVDTVKQAETFAAIRQEYGIERDDNLALRDYPTLNHVIGFVHQRRPDLGEPEAEAGSSPGRASVMRPPADQAAPVVSVVAGDDEAAANVPRRIPTPLLRPRLESTKETGVEIDTESKIVVMADRGGVGSALVKRLRERGATVLAVDDAPIAEELIGRLDAFAAAGSITGVYWLPAVEQAPDIGRLDLAQWREELRIRVKLLYETMRHLYDQVGGNGTFLVAATRFGGLHGYGVDGATAPLGGAVSGFTKAFKREKPEALVKVVDFPLSRKTAALADVLIEETLRDPGAVEVGRRNGDRWTIGLTDEVLAMASAGVELNEDSIFVVTGAAGSIVSAVTADLASNAPGVFHLLDLTPPPDPSDPDLVAYSKDRDGLKRTIFDRLQKAGERATPAVVERHLARIERSHAALSAIQAIEAAGGTVHYHSVNLLDGEAVGAVMAAAAQGGQIDLLLHAAGLEISRLLPDKGRKEYDLVFDVKADGWFNLLKGLGDTPIGSTVVFSSVAGRFGNNGQTDYSAANDLLCKLTANQRAVGSDTLGVAIDWTAWGDIGMATRGSIPTVMKAAGIDMLPAAAGIPIVRREVTHRTIGGEMVAGLRLGVLTDEFDPTGGLATVATSDSRSLMAAAAERFGIYTGLQVTTTLDPDEQPFLFDHQIDGVPVLPGVMGVEAFAAAASLAFPDLSVVAIEDVEFLAPFKFYRNEPRPVTVSVGFRRDGEHIVAKCRLIGSRVLANQPDPQVTTHFTGTVRLADTPPSVAGFPAPAAVGPELESGPVYDIYFHGPAYQVIDRVWNAGSDVVGSMAAGLPPNHMPADRSLATTPRLTELIFQTAGVWEIATSGAMALPRHIERVVYTGKPTRAVGQLRAVVTPQADGSFDAVVVDEEGTGFVSLLGYRTVQLPTALDTAAATQLQEAIAKEG
jgi:acyl transferase domain-containing protein/NAD(P)-dependent dehydrogenase (short-subunit alcohol dehydrogenase family)/acyl carrier protein